MVLHTVTLRSNTLRVVAFGYLARDVGVDFLFNKPRGAVPEIERPVEVGVATDVTPERGGIERSLAAEPGAQLRDIERAQTCSLKIGHPVPRVATRSIQSQLRANQ